MAKKKAIGETLEQLEAEAAAIEAQRVANELKLKKARKGKQAVVIKQMLKLITDYDIKAKHLKSAFPEFASAKVEPTADAAKVEKPIIFEHPSYTRREGDGRGRKSGELVTLLSTLTKKEALAFVAKDEAGNSNAKGKEWVEAQAWKAV